MAYTSVKRYEQSEEPDLTVDARVWFDSLYGNMTTPTLDDPPLDEDSGYIAPDSLAFQFLYPGSKELGYDDGFPEFLSPDFLSQMAMGLRDAGVDADVNKFKKGTHGIGYDQHDYHELPFGMPEDEEDPHETYVDYDTGDYHTELYVGDATFDPYRIDTLGDETDARIPRDYNTDSFGSLNEEYDPLRLADDAIAAAIGASLYDMGIGGGYEDTAGGAYDDSFDSGYDSSAGSPGTDTYSSSSHTYTQSSGYGESDPYAWRSESSYDSQKKYGVYSSSVSDVVGQNPEGLGGLEMRLAA